MDNETVTKCQLACWVSHNSKHKLVGSRFVGWFAFGVDSFWPAPSKPPPSPYSPVWDSPRWVMTIVFLFFRLGRPGGPALRPLSFLFFVWGGLVGQLCCCVFLFLFGAAPWASSIVCVCFVLLLGRGQKWRKNILRTSLQLPPSCQCYDVIQHSYGSCFVHHFID